MTAIKTISRSRTAHVRRMLRFKNRRPAAKAVWWALERARAWRWANGLELPF